MTATAQHSLTSWLVLVYRLPARSGMKTAIRRRLTAIGAVYPANAVAAMPSSPAAERVFRQLRSMIDQAGGSAEVMRAEAIEGGPDLIAIFNAAREREYKEIIVACGDMIAAIKAMKAAGHFRYPDLGEKDAELKRLSIRIETIRRRDTLGAAGAESARSALATCRTVLDDFAGNVYRTDVVPITGVVPGPRSRRER